MGRDRLAASARITHGQGARRQCRHSVRPCTEGLSRVKPIFHPDAERELMAAIKYYADIDPALAVDFEAKVEEATVLAMSFPDMWHEVTRGIRRCLVRRFPYGIMYAHDDEVFYIVAIMHLHAQPDYWKIRTKDVPMRYQRTSPRRRRPPNS